MTRLYVGYCMSYFGQNFGYTPFSEVVSDVTGVELFFVVRNVSVNTPSVFFSVTLSPSPTLFFRVINVTVPSRSSFVFQKGTKKKMIITDNQGFHLAFGIVKSWRIGGRSQMSSSRHPRTSPVICHLGQSKVCSC